MNKVVPALLTDKKEELSRMLRLCAEFTDYVQVDIMDGKFVPSRSISAQEIKSLRPPFKSEAHLMVKDPQEWLEAFKHFGSQKVIYHFEIDADHLKIIEEIRRTGLEAGIAVNPTTKIEQFRSIIDKISSVLFMSVDPGFYGSPFIPQVLDKVRRFKKLFPQIVAGIDGGIKPDNIRAAAASGADYLCVGSAILKEPFPREAYFKLLELSDE